MQTLLLWIQQCGSFQMSNTFSPLGCLGRSGPHLAAYQRGAPAGGSAEGALLPPGQVPRADFTSNKLAPKLAQQLKVNLS